MAKNESDDAVRERLAEKIKGLDEADRKAVTKLAKDASGKDLDDLARAYGVRRGENAKDSENTDQRGSAKGSDQDDDAKNETDNGWGEYLKAESAVHEKREGEPEEQRTARIRDFYGNTVRPAGAPPGAFGQPTDPAAIGRDAAAHAQAAGEAVAARASKELTSSLEARTGPGMSLAQQRQPESDDELRARVLENAEFKSAHDRTEAEEASGEDLDALTEKHGLPARYQPQQPGPGSKMIPRMAPTAMPSAPTGEMESDAEYRARLEPAVRREVMKGFHDTDPAGLDALGEELGIQRLPKDHAASPTAMQEGHERRKMGARHGSQYDDDQDSERDAIHMLDEIRAGIERIERRLRSFA